MNVIKLASKTAALTTLVLLLAACGAKKQDPLIQSIVNDSAQGTVDQAEVALDRTAINGGDLPAKTLALVQAIRAARSSGVSNTWIDKQIDSAEQVVVDCTNCYTMLENVR